MLGSAFHGRGCRVQMILRAQGGEMPPLTARTALTISFSCICVCSVLRLLASVCSPAGGERQGEVSRAGFDGA